MSHQGKKPSSSVEGNTNPSLDAGAPLGMGASAPAPAGGGDAPPSNTASYGYMAGKWEYKLLQVGVDSIYLSFYGDLFPNMESELAQRKYQAQSAYADEKALAQWSIGDHVFEVSDKGQRGFAYILQDNSYRICLRSGEGGKLPVAYVKVSSELLAHLLLEAVIEELSQIIGELCECIELVPTVSRVDLYADFQTDMNIGAIRQEAWVTQAGGIDTYSRKGKFTGWVFGAGADLSARLYDKTTEIEKSHKTYFHELWIRGGWDRSTTVWRLEFQFRRPVLAAYRIRTFQHLKENLGGLWLSATNTWLRWTVPDGNDSNRARWPLHSIWEYLGQIRWRLDDGPLTRSYAPIRVPSLERLYRMFTALLTSYMAVKELQVYGEGCIRLMEDCRGWHESWCREQIKIEFPDWLNQKLSLKARQFNTRRNMRTVRQDAITSDTVEKDASEYYKNSRGE